MKPTKKSSSGPRKKTFGLKERGMETTIVDLGVGGSSLHQLRYVEDIRGDLSVGEFERDVPFVPKRYFLILDVPKPALRAAIAFSGSTASWYARDLKFREGMMGSLSGNLATMGPGVPYVIAAKFAFPDRVAIACIGDGAFQMNGMNEMITIAKYWREWSDPRLIVCVLKNRDLNMVTWEQRVMAGDPRFAASQDVPNFPYAEYGQSLGLGGISIETPDQIASAWISTCSKPRSA